MTEGAVQDDWSITFFRLVEAGMSHDEIGRLTYAQYDNIRHEGKPPTPGMRKFKSLAEARAARRTEGGR